MVAFMLAMSVLAGTSNALDGRLHLAALWWLAAVIYGWVLQRSTGGVKRLLTVSVEQAKLLRWRATAPRDPRHGVYSCVDCGLKDTITFPVRTRCRECGGKIDFNPLRFKEHR